MRIRSLMFFVGILLLGGVVAPVGTAPGRAVGPIVEVELNAPVVPQVRQTDRSVMRSRYVAIDLRILPPAATQSVRSEDRMVRLDLFPDVSIVAALDRFDPNSTGVTWVGHVEGLPASTVTLVYADGFLTGNIAIHDVHYQIRPAAQDPALAGWLGSRKLHLVSQIDQSALLREAPAMEVDIPEAARRAAAATPLVDSGEFVDLLVVYTALAQQNAGGATGIVNLINLGVSETNTSFTSSGVNTRIRLVHSASVPYTETGSFGQAVTDLRLGAGGLSGVAALRDQHRADVVSLLVHPQFPDACGVAFLMTAVTTTFAPFAFNVTDTVCVSPGYTLAHEIGHNMGARHDWYVDGGSTPFTYAHGYVNPTFGQRWRTIMAYIDACATQGFNCTRLLRWANPDARLNPFCGGRFNCDPRFWFFPGVPMGVPGGTRAPCPAFNLTSLGCDADDRRTLNNTAQTVANFRASS